MNEIIANIGESLQGMKGPDVLFLITCILSIPVALSIIFLNMMKAEARHLRKMKERADLKRRKQKT